MSGLDKDGGISFSRKLNFDSKDENKKKPYGLAEPEEPEKEVKQPRNEDIQQLSRQERLGEKLATAKRVNGTGFALNSGVIFSCFMYLDTLLIDPGTLETLNMVNEIFGLDIDFETLIIKIQDYKAQIIGFCISTQTMLMGWKQTRQRMKDQDREDTLGFINDELGKIGV